jgi:hypothetical protein
MSVFVDDVSQWVLFNSTPGSPEHDAYARTWGPIDSLPATQLRRANAVLRRLLTLDGSFLWTWAAVALLCLGTLLAVAWIVRSLPLRASSFRRDSKHELSMRLCLRVRTKLSLDDVLSSAEKVLDSCKLISVFFIFLSPSAIANSVCDTPSVLLSLPGWSVTTTAPSYLSGARVDTRRLVSVMGYTPEQLHAVVALYAATVDYRYFFAVFFMEVFSMTVFVTTWSAARKERWALLYAAAAMVLGVVWALYESQMYTHITLQDNGESFLCTVPYLSTLTRAFAYLHLVIASFYYGIALGRSTHLPWLLGAPCEESPVSSPVLESEGQAAVAPVAVHVTATRA